MSKHGQIYLAAPFGQKMEMRRRRTELQALGCTVVARWLDEDIFNSDTVPSSTGEAPSAEYLQMYAEIDYEDAASCDTFIVFPGQGAGHHTETGIALQSGAKIMVVGARNNIFHYLPNVDVFSSWEDFLATISDTWDGRDDGTE